MFIEYPFSSKHIFIISTKTETEIFFDYMCASFQFLDHIFTLSTHGQAAVTANLKTKGTKQCSFISSYLLYFFMSHVIRCAQ